MPARLKTEAIPADPVVPIDLRGRTMGNLLHWALMFLIVAIVAALLGFGGVAGTAMDGARLLFWVAIILFVVSALVGFVRGRG